MEEMTIEPVCADPGYLAGGKLRRWKLETAQDIEVALAQLPNFEGVYSPGQYRRIRGAIVAAASRLGVQVGDDAPTVTQLGVGVSPQVSDLAQLELDGTADPA